MITKRTFDLLELIHKHNPTSAKQFAKLAKISDAEKSFGFAASAEGQRVNQPLDLFQKTYSGGRGP